MCCLFFEILPYFCVLFSLALRQNIIIFSMKKLDWFMAAKCQAIFNWIIKFHSQLMRNEDWGKEQ